jgi:putative ATPase
VIAREEYPGGRAFEVVTGDLLKEPVDAIVNAANGHLAHGGGVAAAIARAAGPALEEEGDRIVAERGPIPVGEAVVTTAGRLPFKGVIHAVGPHQGLGREEERLEQTLQAAFLRAHERGWASVSFPAVSSGIFAVPLEVCARAYVRAVRAFFAARPATSLRTVRLCLFDGPLVKLVRARLLSPRV